MELKLRCKILGWIVVGCSGESEELPHIEAKTIGDGSHFVVVCPVIWVGVVSRAWVAFAVLGRCDGVNC